MLFPDKEIMAEKKKYPADMLKAAGECCEQGDICRQLGFRCVQSLVSSL